MAHYVYEVNIIGPKKIEKNYQKWLHKHVDDMLELPMFITAEQSAINIAEECFGIRVKYFLESPEDLKKYLKEHAPQMRTQIDEEMAKQLEFFRCNYYA